MITGKVKKSFGKSASRYDRYGTLQREVSRELVHEFSGDFFHAPRMILDIGSGTGFTAKDAAEEWPESIVTAIDIASPMASATRQSGVSRSVAADAGRLPFRKESFDLAISSLALQWTLQNAELFGEIAGVLRKGGPLLFSTLGPGTLIELRNSYDRACRECTGEGARFAPFPGMPELVRNMRSAGFGNVAGRTVSVTKSYDSVEILLRTLKGIGATAPGRPDNLPRRDVLKKTIEIYSGFGRTVQATYRVVYLSGIKA